MKFKKRIAKPIQKPFVKGVRSEHGEKVCNGFDMHNVCIWSRKKAFCSCQRGFKD
jgi:hypothetical protein